MEDFIKRQGLPFLPHLLRRLSDDFVKGAGAWYEEVGVRAPPRTHSTLLALQKCGPMGVTAIAALLRQSHPLVLTWLRQLKDLGFVQSDEDPADGRRSVLSLTKTGKAELKAHRVADQLVAATFQRIMDETDAEVFDALWRLEEACRNLSFLERLRKETAIANGSKSGA